MSKDNIIVYKKDGFNNKKKPDISIIIFPVVLIYVLVCFIIGLKQEFITGYQVKKGLLTENRTYKALAIRDEHVVNANHSGYINYFKNEGERAAYNNLIYCIDETGKLANIIESDPSLKTHLSDNEITDLKQDLKLFSKDFDPRNFFIANSFETSVNNKLAMIYNRHILEDVSSVNSLKTNDIIDFYRTDSAGIVLYYCDGYENKKASELIPTDFKYENYNSNSLLNDDFVKEGDFAYKYINNENWSLAIFVNDEMLKKLSEMDYVEVSFRKLNVSSWAKVNILTRYEEGTVVELSFTNSMVTFCKDRFIDIELNLTEDNGLKIPNSAIANKNFYLIDKKYVDKDPNSSKGEVTRLEFSENGNSTVKNVSVTIYEENDDYYYVDMSSLSFGNVLMIVEKGDEKLPSSTYTVGQTASLIGAYCINRGFTEFKKIEILYQNDSYTIIEPLTPYGLRNYDFIALDASVVLEENDFVNN